MAGARLTVGMRWMNLFQSIQLTTSAFPIPGEAGYEQQLINVDGGILTGSGTLEGNVINRGEVDPTSLNVKRDCLMHLNQLNSGSKFS
jgi:hypothetical protein